ncbi:hypothetical protein PIB30_038985 [Stylosanthes scabra]|uniref:PB1-like domain-containing protein n=1 Tax=Stylosanthes scabra TaxID=79078 RepID=A0ABU6XCN6_9FABA|nr:hypothetical protein [Stylosanthes scabra]
MTWKQKWNPSPKLHWHLSGLCEGEIEEHRRGFEASWVLFGKRKMVYFDIILYHKGYLVYVNGLMTYKGGERVTIGDQDSDFWSLFEAEKQLRRMGHDVDDIASMWYKDLEVEELEVGLFHFTNDRDALEMVMIGTERGAVELYIVHEDNHGEEFLEIGWIDVGGPGQDEGDGSGEEADGGGAVVDAVMEEANVGGFEVEGNVEENVQDNVEASEAAVEEEVNVEVNVAAEGGVNAGTAEDHEDNENANDHGEDRGQLDDEQRSGNNQEGQTEDDSEDSEDGEYLPSDVEEDSADDIQFTDEDELDLDDNSFDVERGPREQPTDGKGKQPLNEGFLGKDGDESEDEEELHPVGGYDRADDDDEGGLDGVRLYPVHKLVDDMAHNPWRVGTVYASRDEFKETVASFTVHTVRGIKFDKCDRMRVIAVCQPGCTFRLYCVKMNEEDSWQLRSMNLSHNCKQVQRVGIMHAKWLSTVFKKKVQNNPKVKLKELVAKADRK